MNVIGNAVTFTDEGHVAIDVGLEEGLLSVAVRDTGVGIPEDKLGHVFGAFQQADMQATRRFEGTGLGLAITRQLITHMGGEISVTSTEGVGSEFFVQIPLKALAQPSEAPEAPWSDISRLAGRRILIVDDMQETRDGLQRVLTNWNMDVLLCASAEEALALKDHDMASIAVAIIDEGLKEPSGVELVAQLRSKLPLGNMPAILYTSHQSGAELRESLAQNVLMLQKPARENSLASRLLEAIGHDRVKKREADSVVIENDALDGLRVLVAEDNKTNRLVLGKLLKTTGVDIVFCENGQEAVDQFQTGGADIILMDMAMPVMDGLEATIAIRSIEQLENRVVRPIIALTANAMPADREACEKAGMSDFLTKPVRKAELIATLNKWAVPEPSREVS
jgi:CheY-like chemotaxis protein